MRKKFSLGLENQQPVPKMLGVKGMNNHIMGGAKPIRQNIGPVVDAVVIDQLPGQSRGGHSRQTVPLTQPNPWEVSLDLTRESQNIHHKIPGALFGSINKPTNYTKVFQQLTITPIIAGVYGTVEFDYDSNGDGLFTWTLSGEIDIIRIHSSSTITDYATQNELVDKGGSFTTSGFRFEADDTHYSAQFRAYNLMTAITSFSGVSQEQSTRMKANKGPNQYQNAIIDVPAELAVDKMYSVIFGFPYVSGEADSFSQTYSWDFADVYFDDNTVFPRSNC